MCMIPPGRRRSRRPCLGRVERPCSPSPIKGPQSTLPVPAGQPGFTCISCLLDQVGGAHPTMQGSPACLASTQTWKTTQHAVCNKATQLSLSLKANLSDCSGLRRRGEICRILSKTPLVPFFCRRSGPKRPEKRFPACAESPVPLSFARQGLSRSSQHYASATTRSA